MSTEKKPFKHVESFWDDEAAGRLSPAERLVYRSNCLGRDQRITNTGGGNTSSKTTETDPLTGKPAGVLWVKGSGGDLRTSTLSNFASLCQDKLLALQETYAAMQPRGPKSEAEDRMVGYFPHCTFNLNPRAASIDTPLHGFVPARHVDHMHPNALIAVAAARRSRELTREIFGDEVGFTPWLRPGFELGLEMARMCRESPELKGILMGQHGVIDWADDDKACYELTLSLIEKAADFIEKHDKGERTFGGQRVEPLDEETRHHLLAELLPWLRGKLAHEGKRQIATVQCDATIQRFVSSVDAPRLAALGTSCPDHFLRTKIRPLYVDWDPAAEDMETLRRRLEEGLERYRTDYTAYYEACRHPDSPPMRNPNPTVILIPGVGMVAWGASKSESRVTAEFYNCAVEVMRGAEAIDEYIALPAQEAFDIEYWRLEEAKLRRMPPEKELARQVAVVVGAGSGIGRAVAHRLAQEGAHVVCVDRDAAAAEETALELTEKHGLGIGVAGSGISGCGPAIALDADVTRRESVRAMFEQALLAYGGIDHVVVTAGVFVPPDTGGRIDDAHWRTTFDVNVTGGYIVADEARRIWAAQGLSGSLLLTTSANAVVAKKGSLAYDVSKAAANHLVRELAIELAPLVRVNAVAPATVVAGSTMFPRERVIASLSKYGVAFEESEPTEALRDRLADFYAQRTLIKRPILPEDQAEAVYFLVSRAAAKTTGQVLAVDGGLHEAFLR
jgi:rhamnulose-1-phosphate aldolase/alcohol dehydrogenase